MKSNNSPLRLYLGRPPFVILAVLGVLAVSGWIALNLSFRQLVPGSMTTAGKFFSAALHPAVTYESDSVPAGTPPLLFKLIDASLQTVLIAASALSIALPLGLILAVLSSLSFWENGRPPQALRRRSPVRTALIAALRACSALIRSIHELMWAVLFLAAFGISQFAAVLSIAIPYAGVFAKVFSEMIDETPADSGEVLSKIGAGRLQSFLFGKLPLALPNIAAYTLYRFECAIRSSAILGFFGYPTLGYYLSAAFENLHYREVWTILYVLFVMIALLDAWSSFLRKRLVA